MFCKECLSKEIEKINTYKSFWYQCRICRNVERVKKEKYALHDISKFIIDNFPNILKKIPKIRGIPGLFNNFLPKKVGVEFYEYYLKEGKADLSQWESEFDIFLQYMNSKVCLNEMKLLDISGEPGLFGYKAEKNPLFKEVMITAYSENVSSRIMNKFGVKCLKYDYQTDQLSKLLSQKYNLVTIRSSINFCLNVNDFVKDLINCLDEEGYVYVTFYEPSLGVALRWQYDDYTYLKLYTNDTIEKYFTQNGFHLIAMDVEVEPYHYNAGVPFPFTMLRSFARLINRKGNLYQSSSRMLFRKNK